MRKRDWADDIAYSIWCNADEDGEFPSKAIANSLREIRYKSIIEAANKAEKWDTILFDKDRKIRHSFIGRDVATDILTLLMERPGVSLPQEKTDHRNNKS